MKIHIKSIQANGSTACGKSISPSTLLKTKEEIMAAVPGGALCPKCLAAAKKQNHQIQLFD
jgi:hypothetical protein